MEREVRLNLITLKKYDEKGQDESGAHELSRIIGVPQPTIWNYVQCLVFDLFLATLTK